MTQCYIFDIDGTLSDISHRRHLIYDPAGKNWDAFYDSCGGDSPIWPVVELQRTLFGHRPVILCTGRPERIRAKTAVWLEDYDIRYDELFMRADGDFRPDHEIKKEMLDDIIGRGFEPLMIFEDRDRNVKMYRNAGFVCAQVAEGNY